jgi:hypothetical protein
LDKAALPDLHLHTARPGVAGFRSPREFRKDGKDSLWGLEEPYPGAIPDRGLALPATGQGTPDHLAAEPYRPPSSAELHVADCAWRKRNAVFDEEAACADIQSLQGRLLEETDLQGLLWLDALRAPALPMWSRNGRAGSEPAELKIGQPPWVARSLRELGCVSSGGCRTLDCLLEFVEATPRAVSGPLGSPPDRIPTKLTDPVAHISPQAPWSLDRSRISGGRVGEQDLDRRVLDSTCKIRSHPRGRRVLDRVRPNPLTLKDYRRPGLWTKSGRVN